MRSLLIACLITLSFQPLCAQNSTIELFDLVKLLAPDSLSTGNTGTWNLSDLPHNALKWESKTPVVKEGKHSLRAVAQIAIYGKAFSCEGKNPCPYKLLLEGNQNGYTQFSIDHALSRTFHPEQSIKYLFNQALKFRLLNKLIDSAGIQVYQYEIKMPGKKPIWVMIGTINSAKANGIYLKGTLEPPATPTPNPSTPAQTIKDNLNFLPQLIATNGSLYQHKTIISRLKKMLGKEYATFMAYKDLQSQIELENGLIYSWSMQAHMGGENEATLMADIDKNRLYVILMKGGRKFYYTEDGSTTFPAHIIAWEKKISAKQRGN